MPNTKNVTPAQATAPVVTGDPAIDTAIQGVNSAMGNVSSLIEPNLTKATRARMPKVRHSAQKLVGPVIDLAARYPQLAPMGMNPSALASQVATYQNLVALQAVVSKASQDVGDTLAQMNAEFWTAALAIYGIAQHSTAENAEVAFLVDQMTKALANGPRVQKYHHVAGPKPVPAPPVVATAPTAPAAGPSAPSSNSSTGANPGNGSGNALVPVYTPSGSGGSVPPTNAK